MVDEELGVLVEPVFSGSCDGDGRFDIYKKISKEKLMEFVYWVARKLFPHIRSYRYFDIAYSTLPLYEEIRQKLIPRQNPSATKKQNQTFSKSLKKDPLLSVSL